ncbi:6-phosphogluconate dehydrogenase, partial [Undibacterium sp. GrIS 1.2]|uniref:phosphogluconate dehydrogenase (NAD(+)-dependent, decarboxylating) n=1 Tax=Undibacterium sp. GrIS 1.2 TaxID=3143933 RepID=UPI0033935271
ADSIATLVSQLEQPRVIWLMLPAGLVDQELATLTPLLDIGDIIIDGGNSYYRDDIQRSTALSSRGIHYVDVGTSGGVFGLKRGYCLMIGGQSGIVNYLSPIFESLAPGAASHDTANDRTKSGMSEEAAISDKKNKSTAQYGYLHCGSHGAGHFVKMVHNGIEYGLMAAYAEGLNILHNANIGAVNNTSGGHSKTATDAETTPLRNPEFYQYPFDLAEITEVWRRGSVISSWLLDLTAKALQKDPSLSTFEGHVSDSGEGRWTMIAAIDEAVPAPVLNAALSERFSSRGNAGFANQLLSAMRHQFGGHVEKLDTDS